MNRINTKVSDINAFIKIFILFGFAAFFITTIFVGSISRYMHPRNIPFMIFAAIVMIIIGVLLINEMYKKKDSKMKKSKIKISLLIFFIIPLIMAFAIPPQEFNSSAQNVAEVQLTSDGGNNNKAADTSEDENVSTYDNQNDDIGNNFPMENGRILMDSEHFSYCLDEIFSDIDSYEGTKVEAIGFVFKDKQQFSDNNFVVGRLMMVCCAADMQTVGFLCHYDKAEGLQADSWVKVIGTISKTQLNGETIPTIEVESVEAVEKPEQDYIYPY